MSDDDQRAWVQMLAPDARRQILIIRDLLRHAIGDDMSDEDRAICRRQLARLGDDAYGRLRWPIRRVEKNS